MTETGPSSPYVTRPTRLTIFLRTFVPWQLWRFARINLKMFGIIRHHPSAVGDGEQTAAVSRLSIDRQAGRRF